MASPDTLLVYPARNRRTIAVSAGKGDNTRARGVGDVAVIGGLGGIARALQHRDYRLYWAGASGSFIGTWTYRTGLGWFTWELTESTAWLGIVVVVEVLPHLFLVPITGALTDRVGPLRMAKLSQLLATVVMAILSILTLLDLVTIGILISIVALNGMIMSIHQPSYFALVPNLVPREDLSAAIALQSAMVQTARFIGPALAGVLIARWGVEAAFAVNAASYICLLVGLVMIEHRDQPGKPDESRSVLSDILDGLRFIGGHFAIRTILMMTVLLALLLRPVMDLLPGFTSEVFGRDATGLAQLMSAAGLGAIFGSLWIARRGRTGGLTRYYAASAFVAAVALLAFALTGTFWLGVFLMGVFGLASNVNSICSQILVQNSVPPALRARVMSLVGLTFRTVPAMGAGVVGWLASIYGLGIPTSVSAILALVTGVWLFRLMQHANLAHHAEREPLAETTALSQPQKAVHR